MPVEARQIGIRHELWMQGLTLARRIDRIPAGLAAGAAGLVGLFQASALDHEEPFEVRLAHRDCNGLSLDYTMVVASPAEHPLDTMRARRALEIMVSTTQTRPKEDATHAA